MKLSVIIPCYNFENWIEVAILSALAQKTNFDYEVIVGDDCSRDNSLRHIKKFDSCIRIIESEKNIGGFLNIKRLISEARGQYIAYLDGDDYWTNMDTLQTQVDYLDQNPDTVLTCCGYYERSNGDYDSLDNGSWNSFPRHLTNWSVDTRQLISENVATFAKVFRNIPIIEDWMSDITFLDWAMVYQLSKFGKIQYLDFPAGVYRKHEAGVFTSLDKNKLETVKSQIREKLLEDYHLLSLN